MSHFWKPGAEKPRIVDDEEGGVLFLSTAASSSSSSGFGYGGMEKQRQRLPVYKYRTAILYLVETHATSIIVGETGSGKTTQIPQYLKEAGWADGGRVIACTQPRRLAVQSVAARVAEEMGVKLGEEVGYTIRFEDLTNTFLVMTAENFHVLAAQNTTMIKFLTDGVLLREMMDDPLLTKYSVIMVDEAHERSISTDILLGLLKKIQRRRPELRLIISSATIEAKSMSAFFQASKRRRGLEGEELGPRMEPAILSVENYSSFLQEPMGDILVFLTGQDDIDTAVKLLNEEAQSNGKKSSGLIVLPLYSGLSRAEQELIFTPTPRGKRKVVISTNIAETSLTLEEPMGDILVFLTGQDDIDTAVKLLNEEAQSNGKKSSGLIVLPLYSGLSRAEQELIFTPTPRGKRKVVISTNIAETSLTLEISDIENLVVAPISKASARQRAGRAGRVRPGKCYRLYTEEYFVNEMSAEGIPEMQRSNLVSCVIQLKALGIDNILGFDWPASPSPEAMIRALEVLYSLGVLDDDAKLTSPAGFQVAEIPLEPMISKMILSSNELGCSEEILTIAAILSVQGDHVTFLNVYKGFLQSGKSSQWCHKNHKKVIEIRGQLRRIAQRLGMVLKSCEGDMKAVRKAVTAGFFANACRLEAFSHSGMYKTVRGSQEVYIHPSSVLFRVNPKWVIFHSLVSTDRQYMRNVISIDPSWLREAAPHFYQHQPHNAIGH
ncbi:putative pre-mrna-splicing factor atp-dependent rna helicase deah9 [Quercus suber]|uniref:RNA helicase n=1 Tax=Quercus suber TaxID=58331 RepID=A0AAW0KSR1_QUESU